MQVGARVAENWTAAREVAAPRPGCSRTGSRACSRARPRGPIKLRGVWSRAPRRRTVIYMTKVRGASDGPGLVGGGRLLGA
jgi:hypothetical protein